MRVSSKYTSSVWEYHKRAFSPNVIKIFFRKNYNIQFYIFSPHYNIYTALLKLSICIKRKLNVLHNKRARKQIANSALNSFNESRLWVDSLGTTYWKRFDSTFKHNLFSIWFMTDVPKTILTKEIFTVLCRSYSFSNSCTYSSKHVMYWLDYKINLIRFNVSSQRY